MNADQIKTLESAELQLRELHRQYWLVKRTGWIEKDRQLVAIIRDLRLIVAQSKDWQPLPHVPTIKTLLAPAPDAWRDAIPPEPCPGDSANHYPMQPAHKDPIA